MISYEITCFINYKYIDRKVYVLRFKIPFYKREGSEFINECKYMREKIGITACLLEEIVVCNLSFLFDFTGDYTVRICALYFVIQYLFGHYRTKTLLIWEEIELLVKSHICFFIVSILLDPMQDFNAHCALLNAVISCIMLCFSILLQRYLRIWFRNSCADNVLIIGAGRQALAFAEVCEKNRFALMKVKGYIDTQDGHVVKDIKQDVFALGELEQAVSRLQINSAVIASTNITNAQFDDILLKLRTVEKIRYMPSVKILTFDTRVEDFDGQLLVSTAKGKISTFNKVVKRTIDILGGIAGCILLIPLTIYVWRSNSKNHDHDPIFFKQVRIGKGGKKFVLYKYRTMIPDAERILQELMEKDPVIREEYETNKKLKKDPRITRAGEFLRRKSLDEFPQFLNVLKGDMSLTGPRPYLPGERKDMGIYYDYVIGCKPGLTGMWQTHGRSDISFSDRLKMDEYYYKNWSLKLDMTILVKTIKTVFHGDGAR